MKLNISAVTLLFAAGCTGFGGNPAERVPAPPEFAQALLAALKAENDSALRTLLPASASFWTSHHAGEGQGLRPVVEEKTDRETLLSAVRGRFKDNYARTRTLSQGDGQVAEVDWYAEPKTVMYRVQARLLKGADGAWRVDRVLFHSQWMVGN